MAYNLGADLQLGVDNDLVLNASDFSVVKFKDNMQQVLRNLLSTERGTFPLNRNYGMNFQKFLGAKGLRRTIAALVDEIYTALRNEPRVKNIYSITVNPRPNKYGVYDVIITLGIIGSSEQIELNLVYPNQNSMNPSVNKIEDEYQTTLTKKTLRTQYDIDQVLGVYSISDTAKENNLFSGGRFEGKEITLGTVLQQDNARVFVDYMSKNVEYTSIKTKFIDYEYVLPVDNSSLYVRYDIYEMFGIYNASDELLENNLYTEGSTFNGKTINLSTPLGNTNKNVLVIYTAYVSQDQATGYNF